MVMKVSNINPILFKGSSAVTKTTTEVADREQIKELGKVTPDYAVVLPQRYTKTGVAELQNGLKLHTYKLANGHKITIIPMENSPATVKNYVNVGSMNETDDIKGISHFLEHMAFNGTLGSEGYEKLNHGDSFNKIEKLGGWINASTNFAVTDYVNSSPLLEDSDLETQIRVIAAMTEDLALTDEMIEKEKGPVCSEIDMILDEPSVIVTDQTVKTLFNIKSSADELIGGSVEHIKKLNRQKVKEYYDKYYTPDNMNLVITGDVNPDEVIELVAKNFHSTKVRQGQIYEEKMIPLTSTVRKDFISNKAKSAEILLGFAGPKLNDTRGKVLLAVADEYLNSDEVGIHKELRKINATAGFGRDKVSTNPNTPMFLCLGADCSEENSEKALKIILTKLANVGKPSEKQLENIKERLLQDRQDILEYSSSVNNMVGQAILDNDLDYVQNYEKILSSITVDEVDEFIKKYINIDKAAITVMHPETTEADIVANYNSVNDISFKGNKRLPVNTDKVEEITLPNNYKVAIQETKSDNFALNILLDFDIKDKNINPAAIRVLDEIYGMGTSYMNEDEFIKYREDNNIGTYAVLDSQGLFLMGSSNNKNSEKAIALVNEVLNYPRIDQETFEKAISKIEDRLNRSQDYAYDLYTDYESKTNPLYITKRGITEGLKTLKLQDIQDLHDYIVNNSTGIAVFNTPEKKPEFKEDVLNTLNNFLPVKEFDYNIAQVYVANEKPVVLTKSKTASQADIMQTYKYERVDSVKEKALERIMNSILTSSKDIGLFNTLREKEHLAYSVYSEIVALGNSGELSCNILTTTDNKEIGEISYDNVQKSINGFHRQINALLNSEYSDDDLEKAKRGLKASLLEKEGTFNKLRAIETGMYKESGIEYQNELFKIIDTITRDDIQQFAQKVFANPPVYSIVASQDTLDANKEYFEKLEQGLIV